MRNGITKAKARAFKKRWEDVNAVERERWRRTPLSRKLQELTALAAWGRYFGWSKSPPDRERGPGEMEPAPEGIPFEEESILPTLEDLIIMKAVAHRSQDIADTEALLAAKPKLNLTRIRKWLKEFSVALDMPEILNDFEDSLIRRQTRKR